MKVYTTARVNAFTEKTIRSTWKTTGNWPINRQKALNHPEIQLDREERAEIIKPVAQPIWDPLSTPKNARNLRQLGYESTPSTRRLFYQTAKAFEHREMDLVAAQQRIEVLEAQLEKALRGKKRKAIPNPNKRFMTIAGHVSDKPEVDISAGISDEIVVAGGGAEPEPDDDGSEESEAASESDSSEEDEEEEPPAIVTKSGRAVKRRRMD